MGDKAGMGMSLLMGMGDVLGVSQLGLRAAESDASGGVPACADRC